MAQGRATASTPTLCEGATAVATAVSLLTLTNANAGATANDGYDSIEIIPVSGRGNCWIVFKIEYAAT